MKFPEEEKETKKLENKIIHRRCCSSITDYRIIPFSRVILFISTVFYSKSSSQRSETLRQDEHKIRLKRFIIMFIKSCTICIKNINSHHLFHSPR